MFHTSRPSTSGSRQFAVDFSDGYGGFQTADYPSSSSQGSFSSGQGSPPLHAAEYSEQTLGLTSPQSCDKSNVTVPPRSAKKRDSPEGGDLIHLENGSVLRDLGGCSAPRKKANVSRPKKVAAGRKKSQGSPGSRGKHPKWVIAIFRAWVAANVKNPYPSEAEKLKLSKVTKRTVQQVIDWFVNERRRNLDKYDSEGGPVLYKVGKGNRRRIPKENLDPQLASGLNPLKFSARSLSGSSLGEKVNQGASGSGWNPGSSWENSASPSGSGWIPGSSWENSASPSSGSGWNAGTSRENSASPSSGSGWNVGTSRENSASPYSCPGWNACTSMENCARPPGNPVSFAAESLVMLTAKHYPDDGSVPITEDSPDPLMIQPPFHGLVWAFLLKDRLDKVPNSNEWSKKARAGKMHEMIYEEIMSVE